MRERRLRSLVAAFVHLRGIHSLEVDYYWPPAIRAAASAILSPHLRPRSDPAACVVGQ